MHFLIQVPLDKIFLLCYDPDDFYICSQYSVMESEEALEAA